MPDIHILNQMTIDKIAAGEVVERPLNVVKELTENAIDAEATAVTIEIKDGGSSLIRVTDNGCGIPKDQIQRAFLRHATSKISSIEDLEKTVSFRGGSDYKDQGRADRDPVLHCGRTGRRTGGDRSA